MCLVGSIIIVLHAPEDKVINTVDEILGYALQPGSSLPPHSQTTAHPTAHRIYAVLPLCPLFLPLHDLPRRASTWQQESPGVHFHLFPRRFRLRHGRQGIRRRAQVDLRGEQPAMEGGNLDFCIHRRRVYRSPDELLQQGSTPYILLDPLLTRDPMNRHSISSQQRPSPPPLKSPKLTCPLSTAS